MRHLPAILSAALLAAACTTPAPTGTDLSLPDAFAASEGSPGLVEPAVMARWWEAFNDPLLSAFVARGLERNLDIEAALVDVDLARAQLRQARLALYPGLGVPAEASRQWIDNPLQEMGEDVEDLAAGLGLAGDRLTIDSRQILVQAQWQPDLFGAGRSRQQAARLQVGAAQAQAMAVRLAITSAIAEAYVQARSLMEAAEQLDALVEIARQSERVTAGFFELGEATRLDLAAASADRAGLEARRGEVEAGLAEAAIALDTLLNAPAGSTRQALGGRGDVPIASADIPLGQPFEMLGRRPDIIAASSGLQAAELSALASRRDLLPQIALGAAAGRTAVSAGTLSSETTLASIAAQFTFPWLVPANHAAVDIADAERERAFIQLRQAVVQAISEVEVAAAQLKAHEDRHGSAIEAVDQAEARMAHAARAHQIGFADLGPVLEAQQGLVQARQTETEVRQQMARAQINLYIALGGGWQRAEDSGRARSGEQAGPAPDRPGLIGPPAGTAAPELFGDG